MKRTVCGLDVHKDSVFCCILCTDGRKIQQKFGVLTEELITLRDLMESEGVEECAMERLPINDTASRCKVNTFVVSATRFRKVADASGGVGHPVEF